MPGSTTTWTPTTPTLCGTASPSAIPTAETGATVSLTDDTAPVTAVEPLLTVTKTVSNATDPGQPPGGGHVLTYEITIPNSGTATAFDVNIVDTLPTGVAFHTGFTPTATIGGTTVPGFVATPDAAPYGPLVWGRENGDESLDVPARSDPGAHLPGAGGGGQRRIEQQRLCGLDLPGRAPAAMSARVDGCPSWTAPDDYCAGPAVASITTVDDTSFAKQISSDSYTVSPLSTATDRHCPGGRHRHLPPGAQHARRNDPRRAGHRCAAGRHDLYRDREHQLRYRPRLHPAGRRRLAPTSATRPSPAPMCPRPAIPAPLHGSSAT